MNKDGNDTSLNLVRLIIALAAGGSLLYLLTLLLGLMADLAPYLVGLWFALALRKAAERLAGFREPLWLRLVIAPFFVLSDLCKLGHKLFGSGDRRCSNLERHAAVTALELDTQLVDELNRRYHHGIGGAKEAQL